MFLTGSKKMGFYNSKEVKNYPQKYRKKANIFLKSYFKEPKNTDRIFWTKHCKEKMRFYGLSESRLKRLLLNPERVEEGIAPKTIAIMQPVGTKKHPTEIWLMYQIINQKSKIKNQKIRIITAWRYPAISPIGEEIPIPEDILDELKTAIS